MINLEVFFGIVREKLFKGSMTQGQVDGCKAIIKAFEDRGAARDMRFPGYGLGTAYIETAYTMQPIKEIGGEDYFTKRYDITRNPAKAKELGNFNPGDGAKYCGRGYPQVTGRKNYAKATSKLGHDFISHPEDAMEPSWAALIMVLGMTEGWFTGKKLSDYFSIAQDDYVNARRIINGKDRASEIAGYAKTFTSALRAAATPDTIATQPVVVVPKENPLTSGTAVATYATTGLGLASSVGKINDNVQPAIEAAKQAKDNFDSVKELIVGIGPWAIAFVLVACIGAYIVYKHRNHVQELPS